MVCSGRCRAELGNGRMGFKGGGVRCGLLFIPFLHQNKSATERIWREPGGQGVLEFGIWLLLSSGLQGGGGCDRGRARGIDRAVIIPFPAFVYLFIPKSHATSQKSCVNIYLRRMARSDGSLHLSLQTPDRTLKGSPPARGTVIWEPANKRSMMHPSFLGSDAVALF